MSIGIDARLTYYRPGGIAEYTQHIIRELAALDHETGYCVIQNHQDANTLQPGPNFRRLNTYTPCHHRLERWTLSAELLPHRLDILHSSGAHDGTSLRSMICIFYTTLSL